MPYQGTIVVNKVKMGAFQIVVQDDGTLQISTESGNVALTVNEAGQPILASASVTTDAIQTGAVTIDKLDDSIQLEPPDGSITTAKLADGAVSLEKLDPSIELTPPDGSITTNKLADGSVTPTKLSETYATVESLNSNVQTLQANISQANSTIQTLQGNLETANNTIATLQSSLDTANASIQSLTSTVATKANTTNPVFKGTITLTE